MTFRRSNTFWKRGTWKWGMFGSAPVPFPIFTLPARKQADKKDKVFVLKPEQYGAWWIVPAFSARDESFAKHSHMGWSAMSCLPGNAWHVTQGSPVFQTVEYAKQWVDKQPTPRHYALVALKENVAC